MLHPICVPIIGKVVLRTRGRSLRLRKVCAGRAQRCETRLAARPAMGGRSQREVSMANWQGMQSLAIGKVSRCSNGIAARQCSQFP
jgi:hypothetical protein